MAKIKKGLWLFSTIIWESLTDFLDRVGIYKKKPFITITCPFENHPEPQ